MNPLQGTEQTALPGRLNPFYLDGRAITLLLPIAQQLGLRDGQIIQAAFEMRGEALKLLYNGQVIDCRPVCAFGRVSSSGCEPIVVPAAGPCVPWMVAGVRAVRRPRLPR